LSAPPAPGAGPPPPPPPRLGTRHESKLTNRDWKPATISALPSMETPRLRPCLVCGASCKQQAHSPQLRRILSSLSGWLWLFCFGSEASGRWTEEPCRQRRPKPLPLPRPPRAADSARWVQAVSRARDTTVATGCHLTLAQLGGVRHAGGAELEQTLEGVRYVARFDKRPGRLPARRSSTRTAAVPRCFASCSPPGRWCR
jgi:hypothetical protein